MKKTHLILLFLCSFSLLTCTSTHVTKSSFVPDFLELTEKKIDDTPDSLLVQLIFDNLYDKLDGQCFKKYETITNWNIYQKAIFFIWLFEAEIINGGFNQFYYNSSFTFYSDVPQALNLVGAYKFSDLAKEANYVFENEYQKIRQTQNGTLVGFSNSYLNNPLSKFDDVFFELYNYENLDKLQVNFIRKYKSSFLDK